MKDGGEGAVLSPILENRKNPSRTLRLPRKTGPRTIGFYWLNWYKWL